MDVERLSQTCQLSHPVADFIHDTAEVVETDLLDRQTTTVGSFAIADRLMTRRAGHPPMTRGSPPGLQRAQVSFTATHQLTTWAQMGSSEMALLDQPVELGRHLGRVVARQEGFHAGPVRAGTRSEPS